MPDRTPEPSRTPTPFTVQVGPARLPGGFAHAAMPDRTPEPSGTPIPSRVTRLPAEMEQQPTYFVTYAAFPAERTLRASG